MYICVYICICIYICIYTYTERERERERYQIEIDSFHGQGGTEPEEGKVMPPNKKARTDLATSSVPAPGNTSEALMGE